MKGYTPNADSLAIETTGYRIKFYRLQRGLTQKQLAEACNLNESTIRNYELDNRTPDLETLTAISDVLDVSYHTLSKPEPYTANGAVHLMFDLEKIYHIHPEIIDGKICLVTSESDEGNILPTLFHKAMFTWADVYRIHSEGDMTKEQYLEWQAKYNVVPKIRIPISQDDLI